MPSDTNPRPEGAQPATTTDPCRQSEFMTRVIIGGWIICEGTRCGGLHRFRGLRFRCRHTGEIRFAYRKETADRSEFATIGLIEPPLCCDSDPLWTPVPYVRVRDLVADRLLTAWWVLSAQRWIL